MNLKLPSLLCVILILAWQTKRAKGTLFIFLVVDEKVFQDCDNEPDYLGVADMLDLSDLKVELFDESVHMEGTIKMIWEADPDDRVEVQIDVLKYARGSWQPTVFTLLQKDFCRTLFDERDVWYQSWSRFIDPDERKCINNKGHVYHHIPFDLETVVDVSGEDISGRHKLVIKVDAYNLQDEKQPYSVCLQIIGDVLKK